MSYLACKLTPPAKDSAMVIIRYHPVLLLFRQSITGTLLYLSVAHCSITSSTHFYFLCSFLLVLPRCRFLVCFSIIRTPPILLVVPLQRESSFLL